MCEILNFDCFRVKSIIRGNKRWWYPNSIWQQYGDDCNTFEEYLTTPRAVELLRTLSDNPSIKTDIKDIYSLHIAGTITAVNDCYFDDEWTKEFIVCGDIMEDYIDWLEPQDPPREMPTLGPVY